MSSIVNTINITAEYEIINRNYGFHIVGILFALLGCKTFFVVVIYAYFGQ